MSSTKTNWMDQLREKLANSPAAVGKTEWIRRHQLYHKMLGSPSEEERKRLYYTSIEDMERDVRQLMGMVHRMNDGVPFDVSDIKRPKLSHRDCHAILLYAGKIPDCDVSPKLNLDDIFGMAVSRKENVYSKWFKKYATAYRLLYPDEPIASMYASAVDYADWCRKQFKETK